MASTIERTQRQIEKLENLAPNEVQTLMTALPVQTMYEARYALQQVKEVADPTQIVEIIEPLARAIGWAEALVFAFDTTKERELFHGTNT